MLRLLGTGRCSAASSTAALGLARRGVHGKVETKPHTDEVPKTLPPGYDFVVQPPRELLPAGVQDKLADYPVSVTTPVNWGLQDMFGHMNNVHYFRFMEDARIEMLQQAYLFMKPELHDEMMRAKGLGVILSTSSIVYKMPVTYPDTLSVGCRIAEWKEDRLNFQYRMVSHKQDKIAAEGDGWMVVYDYRLQKKTPIPHYLKSALESVNSRRFERPKHPHHR